MDMENTATLNIRISQELKQSLEQQAQQKGQSVSDLVRELLETAVTQDGDGVSGIPTELLRQQIRTEAGRRGRTEGYIIERALSFAFENLRVSGLWRW